MNGVEAKGTQALDNSTREAVAQSVVDADVDPLRFGYLLPERPPKWLDCAQVARVASRVLMPNPVFDREE